MRHAANIIRVIVVLYIILFCIFNMSPPVTIVFFPKLPFISGVSKELPVFLPLIAALILGGLAVLVLYFSEKVRSSREINRLKKQLEETSSELTRLRNLPLTEPALGSAGKEPTERPS